MTETVAHEAPDWIKCSQAGDKEAFRSLYRLHVGRVRGVLMGLVGPQDLDDVTQEVFVRVWKALPGFRGDAAFSTWLFRIVRNAASDKRKELAQRRARFAPAEAAQGIGAHAPEPEARLLVTQALSTLSEEMRAVVVMVDLEEFPLQEAADILEIPLGTVKSRLHAARKAMRLFLEESPTSDSPGAPLFLKGGVG